MVLRKRGAEDLEAFLESQSIRCYFQRIDGKSTITKLRIISRHQQLIRLDFEDGFQGYDAGELMARFQSRLEEADVVILSDYGKGTLDNAHELIALARRAGKPVLVDPNSNIKAAVNPQADFRGSTEYRRQMAATLSRRVLEQLG